MEIKTFIENYREAFGASAELPIVFWYSNRLEGEFEKINGCFFKGLRKVRDGAVISLNADTIGCGGGKFYTGFGDMPEHVPNFVSIKECYKQTPEMVIEAIRETEVKRADNTYLHFAPIDRVESLNDKEGILFLANPDMLSGLATWAYFDNNEDNAVTSLFGSGCSIVVTRTTQENRKGGRRTFIGLFDPSVRPYFEPHLLSFSIPISRFKEMCRTMRSSCLFDTLAWGKIRERLTKDNA